MLTTDQHTHHLLDAVARLLFRPAFIGPILAVPVGIAVRQVRKLRRKAKTQKVARAVRGWLAVSAVIDVVSVAEHLDSDGKKYYLATLTYFYRLPDLEMGDYQREFPLKATAQNWVKQFKGHHVIAHVNPKNVTESFVVESDLEGLETHQIPAMESPVQLDAAPALSHGSRFFTALGEQISLAGLAACAVLLVVSLAQGGTVCPRWLLWTGGAMLAVSFGVMIVVQFQCRGDESAKFLMRSYKQWSPAWMRWSLQGSTAVFFLLWFLDRISANLPLAVQLWLSKAEPRLPYFIGCLGFLATASFHTAILRSQELVRLPANGA
jgi:hypothetical protein